MPPPPEVILIGVLSLAGLATWLLTPIVRGLGERLRGGTAGAGELKALRDELQAMRDQLLDEQQRTRAEVGELNERVDFAERLLARRDAPKLGAGE